MKALIVPCPVIITGNGLKSFDESKYHQASQGNHSCDSSHPGNHRVPIRLCLHINHGDGEAGQQLEGQSGNPYFQYLRHNFIGKTAVPETKAEHAPSADNIIQIDQGGNCL